MINLSNTTAAFRNLVGVVAAVLMGSTFLLAATAPAITTGVQVAANSDIVGVA
ncbi:hypothetical protein [Sandarakinorhabdus sp. DWP1-3-1]|uniref:hypothetical protein n=1 Tax=Sandarakinorhabdus sp. DWP1-3-1 TaxID=2804627 RepID=UPI003CEE275A